MGFWLLSWFSSQEFGMIPRECLFLHVARAVTYWLGSLVIRSVETISEVLPNICSSLPSGHIGRLYFLGPSWLGGSLCPGPTNELLADVLHALLGRITTWVLQDLQKFSLSLFLSPRPEVFDCFISLGLSVTRHKMGFPVNWQWPCSVSKKKPLF